MLLLLRILSGVADAMAMPALLGMTAETAAGREGAAFGILRSSQGLSFIAACLGLATSQSLLALIGFYGLYGLASAATFLMSTTTMADIAPREQVATILGAFDALMDLAFRRARYCASHAWGHWACGSDLGWGQPCRRWPRSRSL